MLIPYAVVGAPTGLPVARLDINAVPLSIADGTPTAITLKQTYTLNNNAGVFGTRGGVASGMTVAQAGYFLCFGWVVYAANATGTRYTSLRINGTPSDSAADVRGAAPSLVTEFTAQEVIQLAANDYVEVFAYQTSGGALNVTDGHLTMIKVA